MQEPLRSPTPCQTIRPQIVLPHSVHIGPRDGWPNANPLYPPSIWAPISLLPLMTLSACPLQILAHQRSLRRIGTSRSNVKAFLGAQAGQVIFIIAWAYSLVLLPVSMEFKDDCIRMFTRICLHRCPTTTTGSTWRGSSSCRFWLHILPFA